MNENNTEERIIKNGQERRNQGQKKINQYCICIKTAINVGIYLFVAFSDEVLKIALRDH
tara:strand:+ start:62 stop:238 length:177 start_codon:yes stop_codon:yes gene_type:complete